MNKYLEFLTESKLQLLLEANISYTNSFIEVLNNIDDPISDKLKKLKGKDVDVKTNNIALDYGKTDYILFIPEDKYEKLPWKTSGAEMAYPKIASSAALYYPIGDIFTPDEGRIVEVVKNFTREEQDELLKKIGVNLPNDHLFSHIRWHVDSMTRDSMTRECFYRTDYIIKDLTGFKETPFKIGKFVTNFLTKAGVEFTNIDIERFVDKFKSEMKKKNDIFNNFEIVNGYDIVKYYLEDNYTSLEGTLGNSCMRHHSCQDYFDIYSENTDSVSLIIFKDTVKEDTICGRAILWDAIQISTGKDIKFMDRIYVNKSSDTEIFKQYAITNGFHYKEKQNYSETPLMFNNKVLSVEDSLIKVYVDGKDYDYYPYVDTVKYYNYNGVLSNSSSKYNIKLDSTNGGRCDICDSTGRVECYECSTYGKVDCYGCGGIGKTNCSNCWGDGAVSCPEDDCDNQTIGCPECNSEGTFECMECDGDGSLTCSNCNGEGFNDCPECNGG